MRISSSILACALAFSFTAAQAQSVFVVQLGSFDTEEQAKAAWEKLSDENAAVLAKLTQQTNPISVPPSGEMVYRLQAGPFENRSGAAETCDRLNAAGQECYVAETAMFTPAAAQVDVAKAPTEESATSPNLANDIVNAAGEPENIALPDIEKLDETPKSEDADSAKSLAENAPEPDMAESARQSEPAASDPVKADDKEETSFFGRLWGEDEEDTGTVEQAESVPVESDILPPPPAKVEAPEAESATPVKLSQDELASVPEPVAATEPAEQASAEPEPAKPVKSDTETAMDEMAPAAAPTVSPAEMKSPEMQPMPEVISPLPQPASPEPVAPPVAETTAMPAPVVPAPSSVEQAAPAITPPAAPAVATTQAYIAPQEAPITATPEELAARAPKPLAIPSAAPMPVAPTPRFQGSAEVPAVPPVSTVPENTSAGKVEVSEAVQVPLSQFDASKAATAEGRPVLNFSSRRAAGWGASPSQNVGERALWAQLSYFSSESAAMGYWENLRRQYPQALADIRVRITRPYQFRQQDGMTSLRMGPFLAVSDIEQLCAVAAQDKLTCKSIRDLGQSGAANVARYAPYSAQRPVARYGSAPAYRSGMLTYWLQLGSYNSRNIAGTVWNDLKAANAYALDGLNPVIAQPLNSSSSQSLFRLQTGPFVNRLAAQQKCDLLRSQGVSCLVVAGQ